MEIDFDFDFNKDTFVTFTVLVFLVSVVMLFATIGSGKRKSISNMTDFFVVAVITIVVSYVVILTEMYIQLWNGVLTLATLCVLFCTVIYSLNQKDIKS